MRYKRIFKEVKSKKSNKVYSVILAYDYEGNLILEKSGCDCKYGSFYGWSKKNQNRKTLCRHILQALAKEGSLLPLEYQTTRNLKLMKHFEKMNQKEYFFRNRIIQKIRFSNRSGSHRNCFRYHKNNTENHENVKYLIYKKLIDHGWDVWTECIFNNGSRADIFAIKGKRARIIEIETKKSEKELSEKMITKEKNYPKEIEIEVIMANKFVYEELEV